MWPDRVSNPGPLTYESGALLTALRGLADSSGNSSSHSNSHSNTVELQWLEQLWNHENMFETGVVRANES